MPGPGVHAPSRDCQPLAPTQLNHVREAEGPPYGARRVAVAEPIEPWPKGLDDDWRPGSGTTERSRLIRFDSASAPERSGETCSNRARPSPDYSRECLGWLGWLWSGWVMCGWPDLVGAEVGVAAISGLVVVLGRGGLVVSGWGEVFGRWCCLWSGDEFDVVVGGEDFAGGGPAVEDADDVLAGVADDPGRGVPELPSHGFGFGVGEPAG